MKKLISLILALGLLLAACSGSEPKKEAPATTNAVESTAGAETPTEDGATEETPSRVGTTVELGELPEWQKMQKLANRAGANEKRDHTLMIYMVGSDLEQKHKLASIDLEEMVGSNVDLSKNNVVVFTGGTPVWHNGIPSDVNCVLELGMGGFEIVGTTQHASNTGDPQTLYDFLTFAYEEYPAYEYSLIFWNHGGGSLYGFGSDLLFDRDGLFLCEIGAALEASPFAQEKLRFVGFDACLMATVETAATFAPYANYLIASEEIEPGNGWNYKSLASLDAPVEEFAQVLIDDYAESLRGQGRFNVEYTLSCMELVQIEEVLSAMDELFGAAREGILNGDYSAIAQARIKAKSFAMADIDDMDESSDLIDLTHLASLLGKLYPAESQALVDAIDELVTYNVCNVENADGLSMYYPQFNTSLAENEDAMSLYWASGAPSGYLSFLEVYLDMLLDGQLDVEWESEKPVQEDAQTLSMEFSVEELGNVGRVYCNILAATEEENYYQAVLSDYALEVDENGKVTLPKDPEILMVETDLPEATGMFHFSRPTGEGYVSNYAIFMASSEILAGSTEPIQISLNEDCEITNIRNRKDIEGMPARGTVDPANWANLAYYIYTYTPVEEDGILLPFDQWETDGTFMVSYYPYNEEFSFHTEPLSQQEGVFYVQLCVEDTRGELVYSHLMPLMNTVEYTEETVATEQGTMTFRIYEDHAEFTKYAGDDVKIEVPAEVAGKDVTVVGSCVLNDGIFFGEGYATALEEVVLPQTVTRIEAKAFWAESVQVNLPEGLTFIGAEAFRASSMTEAVIPETVTFIGNRAFYGSELEKVSLPKGLQYIHGSAFESCQKLTAIQMEGSGDYMVVDGVLFTGDGKVLVAYPTGGAGEYVVPEGVEEIGHSAFASNFQNLTRITFPESLRKIDHNAFLACYGLTELVLPESLEFIGQNAFGEQVNDAVLLDKSSTTTTVHIGKNVSFIGANAFSLFALEAYTIDSENEYYSVSDNGSLLNAGGTLLVAVPGGIKGVYEVPYGVCMLAANSLPAYEVGITELILPDTVSYIDSMAGCPEGLERVVVGSGLVYWGNRDDFAEVPNIEISPENMLLEQE